MYYGQERIQMLWGLKLIEFCGSLFNICLRTQFCIRNSVFFIQNYEYKIGYEGKCLFRTRTEITTNYKFKEADKYQKH